jgi:hypothetical protein
LLRVLYQPEAERRRAHEDGGRITVATRRSCDILLFQPRAGIPSGRPGYDDDDPGPSAA